MSDYDLGVFRDAFVSLPNGKRAMLTTDPADFGVNSVMGSAKSAFNDVRVSQIETLAAWLFTYNINPGLVKQFTTSTGSVTISNSLALLSTGTATDGRAKIETIRGSRYTPGIGGVCRFTAIFDTPKENSLQLIGLLNTVDGWAFGYDGLRFGVLRRTNGVNHWTYQEDWSVDHREDLDPTKGNVYEIRYQWLGFGMQYFSIQDDSGLMQDVHRIKYTNDNVDVSVDNPHLPISAVVENTGNNTDVVLKTASAMAGLDGDAFNDALSVNTGSEVVDDVPSGSEVPILAVRLGETYLGKNNRLFAQLLRMTFATSGAKPVIFRFYVGGTVTGGVWNYINEQLSPLEENLTITSYTPGQFIGSFGLGIDDSYQVDLIDSQFRIYPGQTFVATAHTTATASSIVFSENWKSFV